MMLLGSITIPESPWFWLAVPVLIVTVIILVWSYRRSAETGAVHKTAFCLRLIGVLVLLLCLMEPLWSGRRVKTGANLFVVIADNSSGMNIRDHGTDLSRGEILEAALKTDQGKALDRIKPAFGGADWLGALAENFQVRQYVFDSRLRRTTDFSELTFDGKASAIGVALRTIAERYRGRPLAGVLLMTDGNATDMAEQFYPGPIAAEAAPPTTGADRSGVRRSGTIGAGSGVPPVYPVVIGGRRPLKDISLTNVSVSQTSFEDAPVMIQADVEASGYAGKTIAVDLLENSGKMLERQTLKISRNDEKQVFRFRLRPDKTGVLFYHLNVTEEISQDRLSTLRSSTATEDGSDQLEAPSEATLANNKRTLVVDRGKGPYRILYVTGRPNWEYKFLQRAISEDEQVQLVGLLRVARREPKYDWRGRAGEVSNPLFRGFDNKDEEQTEQYDQPVLVRLNTRDAAELRDGFPKTQEELFGYHAVILDDIEAEFFSHDQMELLQEFVAERGGGFLMLGGKESFQQGNFHRTPIGHILPVYLDRLAQQETVTRAYLNLTREGWLQPWARLCDNEQDELQRLLEMPAFRVLNCVRAIKPGARVLATVGDDPAQQFPALVVHRYGNGRAAALTIGDIWRWGLKQNQMRDDMNRFWRQTLRWLVADVPNRISLQATHKRDQVNQPVVLQVRVRKKNFEPMDNVSIAIEVRDPEGQNLRLTAEPVLTESGLFEATYIPRYNGSYLAQAVVNDANGVEVGDVKAGWAVDLEAHEFRSIRTNRPLLERIARQTGGQVIELDALEDFVRSLPSRDAPITDIWIKPLWDLRGILPAIFLLILMCFAGEWTLRRWKGMP
ncbi:MAG TPA: glutamine amidotransferase [Sedimentisphaerales bacterium]|nr:glutamine amidotransferase [Sedimentisphaerales bacterium]